MRRQLEPMVAVSVYRLWPDRLVSAVDAGFDGAVMGSPVA
jgi:hypothetical protein